MSRVRKPQTHEGPSNPSIGGGIMLPFECVSLSSRAVINAYWELMEKYCKMTSLELQLGIGNGSAQA